MRSILLAAAAVGGLLIAGPASAQGVKIGILNDQSGVYADYGGKYSVEAARMAWGLCTVAGVAGKGETLDVIPRWLITGRRVAGSSIASAGRSSWCSTRSI